MAASRKESPANAAKFIKTTKTIHANFAIISGKLISIFAIFFTPNLEILVFIHI